MEVSAIEELTDRLQRFDLYGIPSLPAKYEHETIKYDDIPDLMSMETSWREIIDETIEMPKDEIMIQESIWEIFRTERSYILKLHSAVNVYISCIINLQKYNLLREINLLQLFGNLRSIYVIHLDLWTDAFLPILKRIRETKSVISPAWVVGMFDGIQKRIVLAYLRYLCGVSESINYARTLLDSSACFAAFAKWAEHKNPLKPDEDKCRGNDNNALDSILSGPHQRITRYGLLLDPLCKRAKDNTVRLKLAAIKNKADSLCRWINGRVSLDHLYKELTGIDIEDLKGFSDLANEQISNMIDIKKAFDVYSPMPGVERATTRTVFHQDASIHLKYMKHTETKMTKVNVIIITDAVLICKRKKNKTSCLIRPPIRTDRITPVIQEGKELCLIMTNDFTCPTAAYTLCFEDAKHQNLFLNAFIEARTRYTRLQHGTWKVDTYLEELDNRVVNYLDQEDEYKPEVEEEPKAISKPPSQNIPLDDDGGIWIG